MDTQIINVHTHIFNRRNVPDKFLPTFLYPVAHWLENKTFSSVLSWISKNILGHRGWANIIEKYHTFLKIGDEATQADILRSLISQYPKGTKFCILTMDMEYMGAGNVAQSFEEQLQELAMIKRSPEFKDIVFPFIFAHPDRPNILELVKHFIEEENFAGIKLYPPIGYYPFDSRLNGVFKYAEEKRIPITTHCARGGIYYRGEITDAIRVHPITGEHFVEYNKHLFCQHYTDPSNYEYILQKFPNLVLNLAHFGGSSEWLDFINYESGPEPTWYEKVIALVKKYPNVYTDISYTMYDTSLYFQLKKVLADDAVRSKILFGSDFYMVERETEELSFYNKLKNYISASDFEAISTTNPKRFLNL